MRLSQITLAALVALGATSALAQPPSKADPRLSAVAKAISETSQKAILTKLVGFGTRHTLSDRTSDTRGIGAAERWTAANFEAYSKECGGCLQVVVPKETFQNERVAKPSEVGAIIAIQRGTTDPNRVIVISGHIDSIPSGGNTVLDAPGANDDGSGTTAVIEAARVLSKHKFPATIVYAVLEGEEQGLLGGKVLANYAVKQGWVVEANLNNDIVGNTHGMNGKQIDTYIRVFSEGTKSVETPAQGAQRRYNGGEVDSSSRNLARYIDALADRQAVDLGKLDVKMVYRTDRFGRGGDHTEMLAKGFPAVRITEAAENYDRQHQTVREENGRKYGDTIDWVDFPYLARVTRLNAMVAASLAMAPAPAEGVVSTRNATRTGTQIDWKPVPGAVGYKVWWRDSTASQWTQFREVKDTKANIDDVIIDDWFFGVSSISDQGFESPAVFPGPAGAFISTTEAPGRALPGSAGMTRQ
jgi:hypothetical protein